MEVIRDVADNCIIVCFRSRTSIPWACTPAIHHRRPGPSSPTRNTSACGATPIAVLREVGSGGGPGSNVQFAVNPADGRMVVIEMNPRVSRSSALASKATGFPIAKVAARLAVGYTLDELTNDITGATPASFEPTLDYVVIKIPPREKFPGAEPYLTTQMKSVGEVMAIGRTFAESLQKALRGLETGLSGLDEIDIDGAEDADTGRAGRCPRARRPLPRPAAGRRPGVPARPVGGRGQRRLRLRALVSAPDRGTGRRGSGDPRRRPSRRGRRAHPAQVPGLFRRPPRRPDRAERSRRAARPPCSRRAAGVQARRQLRRRIRRHHSLPLFDL